MIYLKDIYNHSNINRLAPMSGICQVILIYTIDLMFHIFEVILNQSTKLLNKPTTRRENNEKR